MRYSERGNAVIFILLAIALFAGLSYSFMRGAKSGAGSVSPQQAKMQAQELANFFSSTGRGFHKLRQKGCSENDISFSNPADTGAYIGVNDSTTAPPDKSCHIFESNGAGLKMNIDVEKYQITREQITADYTAANLYQHDNIYFRLPSQSIIGVGTSANEFLMFINFVKPEVCKAYNDILANVIDSSVMDAGAVTGDENPQYAGKEYFCRYQHIGARISNGQIFHVLVPK